MKILTPKAAQVDPCLSGLRTLLASLTPSDVEDTGIKPDRLSDTNAMRRIRDGIQINMKMRIAHQICLFILLVCIFLFFDFMMIHFYFTFS